MTQDMEISYVNQKKITWMLDIANIYGRFHFGGVKLALALSYPIVINVPSFKRVMSINSRTGILKYSGHSIESGKSPLGVQILVKL